ncbi:MAG: acetyl-CoA carboxylase biotin carboxyl carrier protein [Gemmatimonadota bacterium]
MDLKFLQKLIKAVDESGVDFIEIDRGGTRIRVGKTPPPAPVVSQGTPAPAPAQEAVGGVLTPAAGTAASGTAESGATGEGEGTVAPPSNLIEVKSPMVGTFYRAPSPDDDPYTDVGSRVAKGDALCIIEAMKLMNELEAEVDGTVVEVCVENGEPVEYGQVLFRLEPA